jgi:hypothetical protein
VTTQFQIMRTISGGGFSWADPIFAPTITNIFDNGTPVGGGSYTINGTGLVTFTVAPTTGHALTWTGTYNWLCRFDEDTASFERFMYWLLELKTLKFSTEKI